MPTTQVSDITSYNHHNNATTMITTLSSCPHCLPPVSSAARNEQKQNAENEFVIFRCQK